MKRDATLAPKRSAGAQRLIDDNNAKRLISEAERLSVCDEYVDASCAARAIDAIVAVIELDAKLWLPRLNTALKFYGKANTPSTIDRFLMMRDLALHVNVLAAVARLGNDSKTVANWRSAVRHVCGNIPVKYVFLNIFLKKSFF